MNTPSKPSESLKMGLQPFFDAAIPENVSRLLEPFKEHRHGPVYAYVRRTISQTHPNVVVKIHRNIIILEYCENGQLISETIPMPGPLAYYNLLYEMSGS